MSGNIFQIFGNGSRPHDKTPTGGPPTKVIDFVDGGGASFTPTIAAGHASIQAKAPGYRFDVTDYGAVGDWNGTTGTNDLPAIQSAQSAAKAAKGHLYFPPGKSFRCDGNLIYSSGEHWLGGNPFGDATTSAPDASSKLVFTGTYAGGAITSNGVNIAHASLSDLTIHVTGTYDWIFDMHKPVAVNVDTVQASCDGTTTGGWHSTNNGGGSTWLQDWNDFEISIPVNSTAYALDCDFSDSSIKGGKFVGGKGAIYRGPAGVKNAAVFFSTGQPTNYCVTISNETQSGSAHLFSACEFDSLVGNPNAGASSNAVLIDGDPNAIGTTACVPQFDACHYRSPGGTEVTLRQTGANVLQGPSFSEMAFISSNSTRLSVDWTKWTGVTFGTRGDVSTAAQPFVQNGYWVPLTLGQSGASHSSPQTDTLEHTIVQIPVPANLLLANGQLVIETLWTRTNGTTPAAATVRVRLGTSTPNSGDAHLNTAVQTGTLSARFSTWIANTGATNSQIGGLNFNGGNGGGGFGQDTIGNVSGAQDTTTALSVNITTQLGNTGDILVLQAYRVTAYPHP